MEKKPFPFFENAPYFLIFLFEDMMGYCLGCVRQPARHGRPSLDSLLLDPLPSTPSRLISSEMMVVKVLEEMVKKVLGEMVKEVMKHNNQLIIAIESKW